MSSTAKATNTPENDDKIPLCVDLDGTLIHTDMMHEAIFLLLRRNIFFLFLLPFWMLKGKANLKAELAQRVMPNPGTMPFNNDLLEWLKSQKKAGRELVLATGSNEKYAHAIANHLSIFSTVEASNGETNLTNVNKANRLVERFGAGGFDYAGNDKDDITVWEQARQAIVVGNVPAARRYANKNNALRFIDEFNQSRLKIWMKAIRIHQWLKNSLLFVPAILGSKFFEIESAVNLGLAFLAFSFCASAVYLLNDLIDIESDRHHKTKRNRPIAKGLISVPEAVVTAATLFTASCALALQLPPLFFIVLMLYFLATCAYSFFLKKMLLIDVLTLAGLFTVRVIAGAAAMSAPASTWLLAFCMFFFLGLALVKRFVEISNHLSQTTRKITGRGYQAADLETLGQAGLASGFAAVVVLALFIDSPSISQNYTYPELIWLVCPLVLYLQTRIWILARRGEMNDDPVVFLMTDWRSQIMIALGAALMLLSQIL